MPLCASGVADAKSSPAPASQSRRSASTQRTDCCLEDDSPMHQLSESEFFSVCSAAVSLRGKLGQKSRLAA